MEFSFKDKSLIRSYIAIQNFIMYVFSFTFISYKIDKFKISVHSAILEYPGLRTLTPETSSKIPTSGGLIFTIILFVVGIYHT